MKKRLEVKAFIVLMVCFGWLGGAGAGEVMLRNGVAGPPDETLGLAGSPSAPLADGDWVRRYTEVPNANDDARAIAVDGAGNIIVTGTSVGPGTTNTSMTTVKYAKNGGQLWAIHGDGLGNDGGTAVTTDGAGNVYVAGYTQGTRDGEKGFNYFVIKYDANGRDLWWRDGTIVPDGNNFPVAIALDTEGSVYITGQATGPSGNYDIFIAKFDAGGDWAWVKQHEGPAKDVDVATSIAVDNFSSRIYVVGYTYGSGGNYSDYVTLQYDMLGNEKWVKYYNGDANGRDEAKGVAVDSMGNVCVTGFSLGSGGTWDCLTVKYNGTGGKIWEARYDGPAKNTDMGKFIAVDAADNIYVAADSFTPGTEYDYRILKYKPDGGLLWANHYNGNANGKDLVAGMALDRSSGHVYLTGMSAWTDTASYDYVTVKFRSTGTKLWVKRYNTRTGGMDSPNAIVLDPSDGSVVVTGKSKGAASGFDFATVKYDKAGTSLWAKRYAISNGDNHPVGLKVDSTGNVYVTGYSVSMVSMVDYLTVKYAPDGSKLWAKRFGGPGAITLDAAEAMTLDSGGNIIVTGGITGFGTLNDYGTVKYDPDGNLLWWKRYNGPANNVDYAEAVAADNAGNVYVSGISVGSSLTSDFTTIKYDPNGAPVWVKRHVEPETAGIDPFYQRVIGVAVDGGGGVYVIGRLFTQVGGEDWIIIKYDSSGNEKWVKKYGGASNMDDAPRGFALDGAKNLYVTGDESLSYDDSNFVTIKYDTNGNQKWLETYDGPAHSYDNGMALALDSANNVYVTGSSWGSGGDQFATIKYDLNGNQKWVKRYTYPGASYATAVGIAVDNAKNAYITGYAKATGGSCNYVTVMYDTIGNQKWAKDYDGPAKDYDYPKAIAVDGQKNVYVTGFSMGASGYFDFATIKYVPEP